jgi:hypothetical protein
MSLFNRTLSQTSRIPGITSTQVTQRIWTQLSGNYGNLRQRTSNTKGRGARQKFPRSAIMPFNIVQVSLDRDSWATRHPIDIDTNLTRWVPGMLSQNTGAVKPRCINIYSPRVHTTPTDNENPARKSGVWLVGNVLTRQLYHINSKIPVSTHKGQRFH